MRAMIGNAALEAQERCREEFLCLRREADKVCAGSGTPLENPGERDRLYVRRTPETERADAVITVTGDSMEPTWHDGDDLLVEFTERLRPGEVGIFVVAGEGTVKEYRPDGLYPHNPRYPALRPGEDDNVRCVGRVLGRVGPSLRPTPEEARTLGAMDPGGIGHA